MSTPKIHFRCSFVQKCEAPKATRSKAKTMKTNGNDGNRNDWNVTKHQIPKAKGIKSRRKGYLVQAIMAKEQKRTYQSYSPHFMQASFKGFLIGIIRDAFSSKACKRLVPSDS